MPPYPSLQGVLAHHQDLFFGSFKDVASTVSCLLTRVGVGIWLVQRKGGEKEQEFAKIQNDSEFFNF